MKKLFKLITITVLFLLSLTLFNHAVGLIGKDQKVPESTLG